MKKVLLFCVIIIGLAACKDNAASDTVNQTVNAAKENVSDFEKMQQEAMDAHDAIMPKMGELMRLKKELGALNLPELEAQKASLQIAHDDMMSWMHSYSEKFPYGFKLPEDSAQAATKLAEMKEEHRKITELKERTLQVISEAQTILEQ